MNRFLQAGYDADGTPSTEKLPGGYSLAVVENPAGEVTERTYARDSDGTLVYSDAVTSSVHGQATSATPAPVSRPCWTASKPPARCSSGWS